MIIFKILRYIFYKQNEFIQDLLLLSINNYYLSMQRALALHAATHAGILSFAHKSQVSKNLYSI